MQLKVLKCSTDSRLHEGTEVWTEAKVVVRSRWHSRVTGMDPYRYVDEMLEGPFRMWKHVHTFSQTDEGTRVIDEIWFELRYGLLGRMMEWYAHRHLQKTFAHRKDATIMALR